MDGDRKTYRQTDRWSNLEKSVEVRDKSRIVVRNEVSVQAVDGSQLPADAAENQPYAARA